MSELVAFIYGSDHLLLTKKYQAFLKSKINGVSAQEVVSVYCEVEDQTAEAIMAARSISMFGPRVLVIKNLAVLSPESFDLVIEYLDSPNPDTLLVLLWEKTPSSKISGKYKEIADAVKAVGGLVSSTDIQQNAAGKKDWFSVQLASSNLRFSKSAESILFEHFKDSLTELLPLLDLLGSIFPQNTKLEPHQIEPYIRQSGSVPIWELTDAIGRGNITQSLEIFSRLSASSEWHPLQSVSSLYNYYKKMMLLDGSGALNEKEAAEILGIKGSTFPAKKTLQSTKKLGREKIYRAIKYIGRADFDIRGGSGLDPIIVLQVLVGRLCQLSK